ncbi:MAG: toxin-antitoxin system TumE family protein [Methanothrix sp.]
MKAQDILDALSSCEIVQDIAVIVLVEEPGKQALRAKASLKEGYVLYVTEAFGKDFRSYSYHLQKNEKMVQRWDNAPHWPEMKTFPHHIHLNSERDVHECQEIFIKDALDEIKAVIEGRG